MIRITDKSLCFGCTACMNICPVQCIVMRRDREGFDYPVANPDRCTGCGRCEKICPGLNPKPAAGPLEITAVRNGKYFMDSSSGGVFPALAERALEGNGVVFGSVLNPDMTVGHVSAEDMASVDMMRGSKYVQSDLYGTFEEAKEYLEEGRKVLFIGTPCQISGLRAYLGKDYDNLLAVDFACHGVPGPGLWEKYVKALEKLNGGKLMEVRFRDKTRSWKHYDFVCRFETSRNEKEVRKPYRKDPYMALFVQDMTLRPSCYKCSFRGGRSGSDLTLGDLWNIHEAVPALHDDRGVSVVFANTAKGKAALSDAGMEGRPVSYETAIKGNGGFLGGPRMPERRAEFFKGHHSAPDLIRYMKGYVRRRPLHIVVWRAFRSLLSKLRNILK